MGAVYLGPNRSNSVLHLTYQLARSNRTFLILLAFLSLISGALSAAFLALITYSLTPNSHSHFFLAVLFSITCVLILLARHGHRYFVTSLGNRLETHLRLELVQTIISCPLRRLERRGPSGLFTVLTHDVGTITGLVLSMPTLLSDAALLLGAFAYLGYLSGYLLLGLFMAVVIIGMIFYFKIVSKNMHLFDQIRDKYAILMGHYSDLIAGTKELKMDADLSSRLVDEHIHNATNDLARINLQTAQKHSFGLNLGQATIYLLIGLVVFVYPTLLGATPEVVLGYVIVILYAAGPLESIINSYPVFISAKVSLRRIADLKDELSLAKEPSLQYESILNSGVFEEIALVDVQFCYPDSNGTGKTIGPINLNLRPGEITFFVGGNGSGKTTLVKLLCGLYAPDSGVILFNGNNVVLKELQSYRERFAVVFSDFHILGHALYLYDFELASKDDLTHSFGLGEVLAEYDTLNIRGLSEGQRRRLALLLSVLDSAEIHLFDEPGSDLDPDTKRYFYEELLPYLRLRGKAVLVVSHDDRYFSQADRLITLHDGKIISDIHRTNG